MKAKAFTMYEVLVAVAAVGILTFLLVAWFAWTTIVTDGIEERWRKQEQCVADVLENDCAGIPADKCRDMVCIKCDTRCTE